MFFLTLFEKKMSPGQLRNCCGDIDHFMQSAQSSENYTFSNYYYFFYPLCIKVEVEGPLLSLRVMVDIISAQGPFTGYSWTFDHVENKRK